MPGKKCVKYHAVKKILTLVTVIISNTCNRLFDAYDCSVSEMYPDLSGWLVWIVSRVIGK